MFRIAYVLASSKFGLDVVENRKISCPCRESNPGRPARGQSLARDLLATCFTTVCLAYSSTLKTEATCSSETSVDFQRTTRVISQKIELFITTAVRTSNPTDEACFSRDDVFKVHKSHLWPRDHHAFCERGYQARYSVSVWAGIVGDIVLVPYLLSDRKTAR
jgi:hypothetical protein